MREANTYRGSRKREARRGKLLWGLLDMIVDSSGTRRVKYPFEKNGKAIDDKNVAARVRPAFGDVGAPASFGRYAIPELLRLRAERGVGSPGRIDPAVRETFKKTKRG